jgi:transcriptional regulator with PAS, ATPase and Fis domain
MNHHSVIQAGFKAPKPEPTPTEALLNNRHGNLHTVIPDMLNQHGATLQTVSKALGVSSAWLSLWLKKYGYRRISRWERK